MAKLDAVSSAGCKYGYVDERVAMSFTESEIDVARQLVRLCGEHKVGASGSDRLRGCAGEDQDRSCSCYVRVTLDDFCGSEDGEDYRQDDDDCSGRPRKRRFRSIDIIYKSTQPMDLLHLNAANKKLN